ncbi:MAG: kinase [Thiotrichales bacterium]|nr:MAG: kinase [Thiotrichales bacterium]
MLQRYKVGHGRANGTFGELLQGMLPNKRSFMVTFPTNLFSYVTFYPEPNSSEIIVHPVAKNKSARMAKNILEYFKINTGGILNITSDIPEGKGLASSSADLVAVAHAISDAYNLEISFELVAKFIAAIEPSDGVMYSGSVAFYYKEVELKECIAQLPPITMVAVDEGNIINTVDYNSIKKHYSFSCTLQYQAMLDLMSQALRDKDLATIGKIATEGAIMNQQYNHKEFLAKMIDVCHEAGGLGVSIAHSGTFMGILLDPTASNYRFQKIFCCTEIKQYGKIPQIFNSLVHEHVAEYCNTLDKLTLEKLC